VNGEIPNDLIEINDPDIDPNEIMKKIRRRIEQRRAELGYEKKIFPSFGIATYPEEPEDLPTDPNLYHHLRLVNKTYAQVQTESILAPSPVTRLPIIGNFWKLIREQAHHLVLFYVNRSITHQTGINRHLISVLNRLTALLQEQQRMIISLQVELEALRHQHEE